MTVIGKYTGSAREKQDRLGIKRDTAEILKTAGRFYLGNPTPELKALIEQHKEFYKKL